jgi:hypothetical protein
MARSLSQINSKKSSSNTAEPTVFKLISFSFHCSSHDKQRGFLYNTKQEKKGTIVRPSQRSTFSSSPYTSFWKKHASPSRTPSNNFLACLPKAIEEKKNVSCLDIGSG